MGHDKRSSARCFIALGACFVLAGCGDPLDKVEKLSTVELAQDAPIAEIAAVPEREARSGGFLSRFMRRDPIPTVNTDAALVDVGDAVDTPRVEDGIETAVAEAMQVPEDNAEGVKPRRGLFGLFGGKRDRVAAVETGGVADQEDALEGVVEEATLPDSEKVANVTDRAVDAQAQPRRGLFGLLSGARAKERDLKAQDDPGVQLASLDAQTEAGAEAEVLSQPKAAKSKLFTRKSAQHKGPDVLVVDKGATLPSGTVARVCGVKGKFGKQVGKFPESGRAKYKMFDSAPGAKGARPFYVTGFDDGCARTFTAALALFGSPSMHEQLRYGLPSQVQPYSTTDKAYEGIKRAVCGVGRKKPCGAKVQLLEKDTAFVSIYDRMGSNSTWSNILLHKGWVLAADRKD